MPSAHQLAKAAPYAYKPFLDRLCLVLDECARRGAHYVIDMLWRSEATQDGLYAIGRTVQNKSGNPADAPGTGPHGLGRTVTNARWGQSGHSFATAADCVHEDDQDKGREDWIVANYAILEEEAAKAGLVSGADFGDHPHVNWPGTTTGAECAHLAEIYRSTPGDDGAKCAAVWALLDAAARPLPAYPAADPHAVAVNPDGSAAPGGTPNESV